MGSLRCDVGPPAGGARGYKRRREAVAREGGLAPPDRAVALDGSLRRDTLSYGEGTTGRSVRECAPTREVAMDVVYYSAAIVGLLAYAGMMTLALL
jgi:hypothetical protein